MNKIAQSELYEMANSKFLLLIQLILNEKSQNYGKSKEVKTGKNDRIRGRWAGEAKVKVDKQKNLAEAAVVVVLLLLLLIILLNYY